MKRRTATILSLIATMLLFGTVGQAANRFRYPEAKHGKGELRYVNGVPVLLVQGTPAEIGDQIGRLALKPFADANKEFVDQILNDEWFGTATSLVLKSGSLLLPQFPSDHLAELDALANASGIPRDLVILGNTFRDLRKVHQCSTLVVEGKRSATGKPLFGRNLDWSTADFPLHEYTLVTVYRPSGKHAFASIGFPGMVGCAQGINDAGLALADLTVSSAADGSPLLDITGTPYGLALRRVLEECTTIEEAERLRRSLRRTIMQNIAICDKHRSAVFEVTTKQIVVRHATDAVCACTNSFRTKELAVGASGDRYEILDMSRKMEQLDLVDVAVKMDAVAGDSTVHTMIFEPADLKLHLAFGPPPASQLPLREIDLTKLFTEGKFPTDRELVLHNPSAAPPLIKKVEAGKCEVVFRYRPVGHVDRDRAVYLAGTFNDWKPTALKMSGPDKDGCYQTSLKLPDGRYEYKFVIDGKRWLHDPSNDEALSSPYRNSVIEVGRPRR